MIMPNIQTELWKEMVSSNIVQKNFNTFHNSIKYNMPDLTVSYHKLASAPVAERQQSDQLSHIYGKPS